MTINHIDQLAQWWETAEEGDARPGDTIITPGSTHYLIETAPDYPLDRANQPYRILARAPKPKPAWHDAPAVMARCSDSHEAPREVFTRSEATPGVWIGEGGWGHTEDLRDVSPLIEAKVTDEARDRVWRELVHYNLIDPDKHRPSDPWTADVVHVALGLETE